MVPKLHAMSDIYCQLIPNEDDSVSNYEIVPRVGAFEISVNGVVSILFQIIQTNKPFHIKIRKIENTLNSVSGFGGPYFHSCLCL